MQEMHAEPLAKRTTGVSWLERYPATLLRCYCLRARGVSGELFCTGRSHRERRAVRVRYWEGTAMINRHGTHR